VLSGREWNPGPERLFSVTMDNATNNTRFREALATESGFDATADSLPRSHHELGCRRLISHTSVTSGES